VEGRECQQPQTLPQWKIRVMKEVPVADKGRETASFSPDSQLLFLALFILLNLFRTIEKEHDRRSLVE
jgi:hypothetical protein